MDKDELRRVEALVDGWKSHLADDEEKFGPILEKVEQQEQAEMKKNASISRFGFINAILRRFL